MEKKASRMRPIAKRIVSWREGERLKSIQLSDMSEALDLYNTHLLTSELSAHKALVRMSYIEFKIKYTLLERDRRVIRAVLPIFCNSNEDRDWEFNLLNTTTLNSPGYYEYIKKHCNLHKVPHTEISILKIEECCSVFTFHSTARWDYQDIYNCPTWKIWSLTLSIYIVGIVCLCTWRTQINWTLKGWLYQQHKNQDTRELPYFCW